MSNFLPLPTKRATPIPDLGPKLLSYTTTNFRDAHPEAFKRDVEQFVALRREWVEGKGEAHPEGVKGLMRYHAQLAFLVTKFPRDIGVAFSYHTPFPPPFSLTPDSPISLNSLTFERASVLFNVAALYATMAAAERRAELEGIKRALGYLTSAAGVLSYLITSILPTFKNELPTPNAAGYDMTESFLSAMREFVLAQAQECFWQQAVMQGSYKDPIVAKLSMKVSEYYKSALSFANSQDYPSAAFLPANWTTHITIKQLHFEAAAQYRMSKEDVNKSRYGVEIGRLRVAEGLAKKGLSSTRGVAEPVVSDLKLINRDLQNAVKTALERAVRENDLIYVSPVPPANQLDPINGAGMVKLVTPPEIAEPVEWLMKGGAGVGPLFSGLVPYGVHLALSVYDDRKDTLVRELDSRREELDGLAASTLQSLSLPGSIQALDRPIGLPPSLLKKAEEVDAGGGIRRIEGLLDEVARLSKANRKQLEEAMDILDDEATEHDTLVEHRPDMANSRPPSHIANAGLIQTAQQYEATVKAAADSDATVRRKWEEWESRIALLADEDDLKDYIPSTTSPTSLPASVRPLRASLEELDDRIANRARIIQDARGLAQADDIRPQVLAEAGRMAHGGSGDVRTEWFEGIFDKGLEKYEGVKGDMTREVSKQEALLERIRTQNEAFLGERKDDPRVRAREQALQEMDAAFWKWRELIENLTEGVGFYNNLAEILRGFKVACGQFLNSRRADVGQITSGVQHMGMGHQQQQQQHSHQSQQQQQQQQPQSSYQPSHSSQQSYQPDQRYQQSQTQSPPPPQTFSPGPSYARASPQTFSPPPPQQQQPPRTTFLPHPSSATWQDAPDFLPPPPPQPILRSGGIPAASTLPASSPRRQTGGYDAPVSADTPKRVTRSQAQPRGPIGDAERNPYKGTSKSRRDGGVV